MPEPDNSVQNHVPEDDIPLINSNVIRIQLQKPRHRKWELVTRNCSPGRVFPTIQLFDCEGNLLLETNDDNISVKSSDIEKSHSRERCSKSFGATDFAKRPINYPIKKTKSVTGDQIYTRFYERNSSKEDKEKLSSDESPDIPIIENKKEKIRQQTNLSAPKFYQRSLSSPVSLYSSGLSGLDNSEFDNSSYKSSDNESCSTLPVYKYITANAGTLLVCENQIKNNYRRRPSGRNIEYQQPIPRRYSGSRKPSLAYYKSQSASHVPSEMRKEIFPKKLKKSASCYKPKCKNSYVRRANTDSFKNKYIPTDENGVSIIRNMSFLDIYLKSLPSRNKEPPAWLEEIVNNVKLRKDAKNRVNEKWRRGMILSDDSFNIDPTLIYNEEIDSAVENEIRRRLKKYHRVMSCSDYWTWKKDSHRRELKRRYSEGASDTSSSESVDEADRILMRLRRRIFQNKKRERRFSKPGSSLAQYADNSGLHNTPSIAYAGSLNQDHFAEKFAEACVGGKQNGLVRGAPPAMGASVGRHGRGSNSTTGGNTGGRRRAQSSGDLCAAPDVGSFRDSCSVAGSVSDAATWNSRSLPSHLDGRRRLPCGGCGRCGDCVSSSENNNYNYTRSFGRPPHRHHHRKFSHQYGCKLAGDLDPVWKLQDPGCDQGYGSERSPEEEFPPAMPLEDDYEDQDMDLRQMYPFINDDNTFTVRVEKDRRGLGLSVAGGADSNSTGGTSGLIRIRRLYPSQPAWSTGRLRAGDLLLAANGVSLAGLTTYEALEVLRTTPPVVELVVCRPGPELQGRLSPTDGTPPAPPIRQVPLDPLNLHAPRPRAPAPTPPSLSPTHPPNNVSDYEEPNPVYDVKYGEFDIVMTKVNGSLGFTLRKEDHSALGHYVRALVREPALSDGRIQPGDRIVAVNDVPMSTMSHSEAVSFLRRCGPVARLRLYRDHCGTPPSPSAASPTTESDTTLITRPKPPLRQEAVNMLCDIAARKLTPDDGNGTCSPCVSPRRYKKPTRNNTGYSQNSDTMHPYSVICPSTTAENSDNEMSQTLSCQSTDTADTTYSLVPDRRPLRPTCFNGQLFDNSKPARPDFLDLGGPPTPVNNRKQRLHFSVAAHGYELNNLDNDLLDAPNVYQDMAHNGGTGYLSSLSNHQIIIGSEMSNEPMSMPIELIASADVDKGRFSHKNPAYQSAVVQPSSNNQNGGYDSSKDDGFKKWKNANLSPENGRKSILEKEEPEKPTIVRYPDENRAPGTSEPRVLTVELNRGWNSRLGFSIQCHPDSGQSFISAIYSNSVAAKDGRLRQGDIILQVNDENITSMTTQQVIDLLRILRGSICITVLRQ